MIGLTREAEERSHPSGRGLAHRRRPVRPDGCMPSPADPRSAVSIWGASSLVTRSTDRAAAFQVRVSGLGMWPPFMSGVKGLTPGAGGRRS
ncbi:hypothetical protein ebA5602 [Aromatoleum aromaticum EbN1]|uniref:Uncharacterized protein n=1 Tax=Aromatoleum aromaticum (strain DSM 19018 / LMG 30748 / EbN1) TaxID=76114 RepID=Q5P051_AROAE|nr:hypothetical protein ebA5602 [Aromatoleum aromaticum EbN1]